MLRDADAHLNKKLPFNAWTRRARPRLKRWKAYRTSLFSALCFGKQRTGFAPVWVVTSRSMRERVWAEYQVGKEFWETVWEAWELWPKEVRVSTALRVLTGLNYLQSSESGRFLNNFIIEHICAHMYHTQKTSARWYFVSVPFFQNSLVLSSLLFCSNLPVLHQFSLSVVQ